MDITFDSSISTIDCQPIQVEADDVEFDISDDVPVIKEFLQEVKPYDPYKIVAGNSCGGKLDCFG